MKKYIYHFKCKIITGQGATTTTEEKRGTIELVAPSMMVANRLFDQLYAAETFESMASSMFGGKKGTGLKASIAGTVLHVYKIEETEL